MCETPKGAIEKEADVDGLSKVIVAEIALQVYLSSEAEEKFSACRLGRGSFGKVRSKE
ncbi:uncharacterized protein FIBRA_08315 [Fibroporia radiculosa]|uniref:Uncharacterized protein n=1 Tax=Fibroporia radiculosa TaxID=599839 RepID=J4GH33_9APHY|nr:uncharacterized protein FIBRA_08315 [Fibroporia radiculosa]CCM06068.1 predicted protein [Fibroporia radiculosa]